MMIFLKSDDACAHCPMNLCCLTGQTLTGATRCIGCHAVLFRSQGIKYICLRLREGVYSRLKETPQLGNIAHIYTSAALGYRFGYNGTAYKGCIRCPSCSPVTPPDDTF